MRKGINSSDFATPLNYRGVYFCAKSHIYAYYYRFTAKTQGNAVLLKSPQGKFILVDGGGSQFLDVGAKTVLPYLHYRGIRQLDIMINTHPDIDHLQGLEGVAEQMPVRYLGLPASIINC